MAIENAEHHLRVELARESGEQRRGQESVADLQKILALPVTPRRIEAFDISNIQGTNAVGSMIVFEDGLAKRSDYRRFRIQLGEGEPNDYAMMHEVLSRRLNAAVSGNVKFSHLADLMLVDGGIGQLNVALKAMQVLDLQLPVAAIAKEREEVYLPERPTPISLPEHSRALHLLQRVRDEAHRFAVSYHRTLRAREVRESVLDGVPGIGEKRKQRLLSHFHSLRRLSEASVGEIAAVAGCSHEVAGRVLAALTEDSVT
jgi:excinuclease ABC subunit C